MAPMVPAEPVPAKMPLKRGVVELVVPVKVTAVPAVVPPRVLVLMLPMLTLPEKAVMRAWLVLVLLDDTAMFWIVLLWMLVTAPVPTLAYIPRKTTLPVPLSVIVSGVPPQKGAVPPM